MTSGLYTAKPVAAVVKAEHRMGHSE